MKWRTRYRWLPPSLLVFHAIAHTHKYNMEINKWMTMFDKIMTVEVEKLFKEGIFTNFVNPPKKSYQELKEIFKDIEQ